MEIKIDFFNKTGLKQLFFAGIIILGTISSFSQTLLTEQEVVNLALKNSPMLNASTLQVQQQKQLEGTSLNIPNPSVLVESPTGEFMTVGMVQSFEFPTVYHKQHQLSKEKTLLAGKNKSITESEVKRDVRTAYLNLQYANALLYHFQLRDSLYFSLADAADRNFNAGQIDYVSKSLIYVQYGEVHNRLLEAQSQVTTSIELLQLHTGISDLIETTPLSRNAEPDFIPETMTEIPLQLYYKQYEVVAQKTLELERSKALPGFSIGYMNQGVHDTHIPLRLQAGINVPLWFGQYKSSIQAAKTNVAITQQNSLANERMLLVQINQAKGERQKLLSSLAYYEQTGLRQTDELISASRRLFAAGEIDYSNFLRNMNDAYSIQLTYLEAIKNYNQSILTIKYLTGKL